MSPTVTAAPPMQRTNFVLIDLESVQPETLDALLSGPFKVLLFVGAGQTKVAVDLAASMQRLGERAEYIRIAGNGPNALDFHIAFYIGQLSAQDPNAYFHIISKDTGFDPLIQHLKSRMIMTARSASVADIPILCSGNKKSPAERAELFMAELRRPKVPKPGRLKTLGNSILSFFQHQLSEDEIASVIAVLQASGAIRVADGKVTYAEGI